MRCDWLRVTGGKKKEKEKDQQVGETGDEIQTNSRAFANSKADVANYKRDIFMTNGTRLGCVTEIS